MNRQIGSTRQILSEQAVGVFVSATLPRGVGIGKKYLHVQRAFQELVFRELAAVVEWKMRDKNVTTSEKDAMQRLLATIEPRL